MPEFPLIPGYKIERELGQGGMARVYLAHEEKLERHVALKVLSLLTEEGRPLAERFIKEAKTSARLHHSYIITIHDVGQSGNLYYMAVEYLPGGTLKERLRQAALPPTQALQILGHLAEALEYAHGQGFVHRDIKPENVMFRSDGRTVLTDFGIARAVGSATKLTKTGQSIGTPHYMSPEQARGQAVDGRSDIYSLGILFHEMLTGKVPYDAEDSVAVVIQHLQSPIPVMPVPLVQYQPLLEKMMAKDPGRRFQNCRELLDAIERISGGPGRAVPVPGLPRPPLLKKITVAHSESRRAQNMAPMQKQDAATEKNRTPLIPWLVGALVVLVVVLVVVLSNQKPDPAAGAYDVTPDSQEPSIQTQANDSENQRMREQLAAAEAEKKRLATALKQKEDQERERQASEARQATAQAEQQRLARLEEQRRQSAEAARQSEAALARQKQEAEARAAEAARYAQSASVNLRSSYQTVTVDNAKAMLNRLNFYDLYNNPSASGINHQYQSRTISGDRVVIDGATGLMWHQSGSDNYLNYAAAQAWLADLNRRGYAGYSDWRLPTLEEGASLLESSKKNGDLYIDPIFSNKQRYIWTGDSYSSAASWVVYFGSGGVYRDARVNCYYVRPVRSGK